MKTIKNYLAIFTILTIMLTQVTPAIVLADEPTPAPTQAVQENTGNTTSSENTQATPTAAPQQTVTPAAPTPTPTLTEEEQERAELLERRARSAAAREQLLKELEQGDVNRTDSASSANNVGTDPVHSVNSEGNVGGDTTIKTGEANLQGGIVNNGNINTAESAAVAGGSSGAQVVTNGNGSDSTNTGTIITDNNSATIQENNADLANNLTQSAVTGLNNNSKNVGGDSSITTGDANVTGTIMNMVNTNAAGVMVSEFNVVDDHYGDLVIDFASACIAGCGNGSTVASNTGNGSYSDNNAAVFENNNSETTQINDALIGNELNLNADSGNNTASKNTGGDSNITTGDANVVGNILNFANTNIAGNAIVAFVNIFGKLVGDIVLTEDAINNCCGSTNTTVANNGNGSNSNNTALVDVENNDAYFQTNDAVIDNTLNLDAQTGNNATSNNTGGNSSIDTGNVTVDANVMNVVNTNLLGGNMWLAIVNEAGKWVGKIMGAPEGTKFAASQGTDYSIDENGYVTATNNGNGSGSENNSEIHQTNNNTTTQDNTAQIGNTMNLSANTGGNRASDNTGGNSNIQTGDATIIANMINFVNTNIAGDSKFVVLIVNPIGEWIGDLVLPGQKKEPKPNTPTETASNNTNNNAVGGQSNNNSSNNNSSSSNNNSSTTKTNNDNEVETEVKGEGTVVYNKPIIPTFKKSIKGESTVETTVSGETKVAGIHAEAPKNVLTQGEGKVKINLAYLVLILPIAVAAILTRKVLFSRLLSKRK